MDKQRHIFWIIVDLIMILSGITLFIKTTEEFYLTIVISYLVLIIMPIKGLINIKKSNYNN